MAGQKVQTMSVTAAASAVYDLRFEGYSLTTELAGRDEYYQTDQFTVGGYEWAVRYYPDYDGSSSCVTLFLVLLTEEVEPDTVAASFSCALLNRSGQTSRGCEGALSQVFHEGGGEESDNAIEFPKNVVDSPKFLVGDCFVVRCTVSVLKKPMS